MNIVPVRAFRDNYIWMLVHRCNAVAVDPGEAAPVLAYLQQQGLALSGILITHHHNDHIGGVDQLLSHSSVPVYAPRNEFFGFPHQPVGEGDRVALPVLEATLDVLDIPGHTAGHVAYYGGNSLFCGDTLFGCGCGRVLEGSCEQLYHSLQKLARLPDETRVYCAHEYTLANLQFARTIDPDNPALLDRENTDTSLLERGMPTLPSTIGLEKSTNPFLRCNSAEIEHAASRGGAGNSDTPEAIFCAIREMKNRF